MRQQVPHADLFPPVAGEFRQIDGHRSLEVKVAALDQEQDGGSGGHDLGQRSGVKNRVEGHRLRRRKERPVAIGAVVNGIVVFEPEHGAGAGFVRDG